MAFHYDAKSQGHLEFFLINRAIQNEIVLGGKLDSLKVKKINKKICCVHYKT